MLFALAFSLYFFISLCFFRQVPQLVQGHAVHVFVDKIVQPAPEIQRVALAPAGALNAGGQAGDSRQLAFHRTQDLAGSDLGIRGGPGGSRPGHRAR